MEERICVVEFSAHSIRVTMGTGGETDIECADNVLSHVASRVLSVTSHVQRNGTVMVCTTCQQNDMVALATVLDALQFLSFDTTCAAVLSPSYHVVYLKGRVSSFGMRRCRGNTIP